jgi:hypothetical protein
MFSVLVSADGMAWEVNQHLKMPRERFHEYCGPEADSILFDRPESRATLEPVDSLLIYELGADGPNVELVRVGKIAKIRAGKREISFSFKETGRVSRAVIVEHQRLLGIDSFEFHRTHWAIKDGELPQIVRERVTMSRERYDVALSFAGEDRKYVEQVANYLVANGVEVFYDGFEQVDLWGKDLADHFDAVYRTGAKYCVVFISKHYAEKMWTNHERRSAFAAAVASRTEYVLPVRFDATELPGLRPTIGYISLSDVSPEVFAELVIKKLAAGS